MNNTVPVCLVAPDEPDFPGSRANCLNIRRPAPFNPWPARLIALLLAMALHSLAWWQWHSRPAVVPARPQRVVQVALVSQPKAVAQPAAPAEPVKPEPPPPKPPEAKSRETEKSAPKKPRPAPKPLPRMQPEPAARTPEPAPVEEPAKPVQAVPSAPPSAPKPFQAANYRAAYLQNPAPRYPPMARERRWQGEVLLRARILADGSAGEVRLERSSGHEMLDEAALEAVQRWRFEPAKEADAPVDSWAIIPIEFKLKN